MIFSPLLRRISWFALAPGVLACIVAMIGVQLGSTNDVIKWCVMWWWFLLVCGVTLFLMIRAAATMLRKLGGRLRWLKDEATERGAATAAIPPRSPTPSC